jgi:hypothetical protein
MPKINRGYERARQGDIGMSGNISKEKKKSVVKRKVRDLRQERKSWQQS